ncbi:helix-turn-helix transcriptional regulator [Streptomyces sp. NPDC023838]|uniref:helix-turn-helix domain-containing protein n=1 Tax=Streptomyces sp. NPDC023838 TaxID=3154325 RepID=UPI0033EC6ACB
MSALPAVKEATAADHQHRCRGCNVRLSRYNSDAHCSACARRAWRSVSREPRVPLQIWSSAEVRTALVERNFGALCLLVRRLGSLKQEDLAELTGLSQAFLSMLESGTRRLTNIEKIVMLLNGLDVPLELTGPILRSADTSMARIPQCVEPEHPSV